MKIIDISLNNVPQIKEEISLCLGYFDGVHIGHQEIIKKAKKSGNKVAVLTFTNSPAYVLGKKDIFEITSLSDKAELFEDLGVDYLFVMNFDRSSLNITKDEFINSILKLIAPKKIYCGEDYTFGTRGEGNPSYLSRFFDVEVVSILKIDDVKVSSKNIRELIGKGEMIEVKKMLDRPYALIGLVIEGNHIGNTIDFPTANLDLDYNYVLPKSGVYLAKVKGLGGTYNALVSIGTHPTIYESKKPLVEVHILDFEQDIYGRVITVEILNYIRDIIKFENLDELKVQIAKDKEFAEKQFALNIY